MVAFRELYPFQKEALQKVSDALMESPNVLLHAATGAGKTIIVCELIRVFKERWPDARVLFLAHSQQLVQQAEEKLRGVWEGSDGKIGFACRSVSSDVDLEAPIVIGSYQTLVKRLDSLRGVKLVIIDEAHRLPLKARKGAKKSSYERILDALHDLDPNVRLLGITATPFMLRHGYIYGTKCMSPERNWFPRLAYSIGILELQKLWFLCPLKVDEVAAPDFSHIGINKKSGDYDEGQLGAFMSDRIHIDTAVDSFRMYAADRKHAVVFAVTIEHANLLAEAFAKAGYPTGVVHSDGISRTERRRILDAFEEGEIRVLVNVGILTEGWDSPHVDCLVLCRPTKSTALHVQIVGRGLRMCEGKNDCLVLDLVGNRREHGDVHDPKVRWRTRKKISCPECRTDMWTDEIENQHWFKCKGCGTPLTVCMKCGTPNLASNILCTHCEKELYPMKGVLTCPNPDCQVDVGPRDIFCKACGTRLIGEAEGPVLVTTYETDFPERWVDVMAAPECRIATRNDKELLEVRVLCRDEEHNANRWAYATLDPEGFGSERAAGFCYVIWRSMSERKRTPKTAKDAYVRLNELSFPPRIRIARMNGRNWIRYWGQNDNDWRRSTGYLNDRSRFPVVGRPPRKALPGNEPDRRPV